ncbi:MAG: hypothetical protein OZ921_09940 [Sorangiineae bacterium]|nr:hypothetical protein [Polyangiaceae bacterium]MEB2322825.1 hypothetical protein [Sorangiineae bacterium]
MPLPARSPFSPLTLWGSAVVALALGACTSANPSNGFGGGSGGASGQPGTGGSAASSGTGGSPGGGTGGGGIELGDSGGGTPSGCSKESQFVYVIGQAGMLYKFDPPSLAFTQIGMVKCGGLGNTPYSMAVDREANAWIVTTSGKVFRVSTADASCTPTGYAPNQAGVGTFGMGFSTAGPGSTVDTLFIADSNTGSNAKGLGFIDTATLQLNVIGNYDLISARAELTGTGDGRLYAAFEGTPYVVAELDKTSAHVVSQAPQSQIKYGAGQSNFAFAFWGGSFWLFVGPGTSTDVFEYDPASGTTAKRTSVSQVIVGAGVSTCAPLAPPR